MGQAGGSGHPGGKSGVGRWVRTSRREKWDWQVGQNIQREKWGMQMRQDIQEGKVGQAGGSGQPRGKSGAGRWVRTFRREKWGRQVGQDIQEGRVGQAGGQDIQEGNVGQTGRLGHPRGKPREVDGSADPGGQIMASKWVRTSKKEEGSRWVRKFWGENYGKQVV